MFEAYDDMEEVGSQEIRGVEARLFRSSLMEQPVRAAIWREPLPSPCDAHAVIAVGLTDAEFDRVLAGLR